MKHARKTCKHVDSWHLAFTAFLARSKQDWCSATNPVHEGVLQAAPIHPGPVSMPRGPGTRGRGDPGRGGRLPGTALLRIGMTVVGAQCSINWDRRRVYGVRRRGRTRGQPRRSRYINKHMDR